MVATAIAAGASVLGGVLSSRGASKAASAQTEAAAAANALQQQQFEQTRQDQLPFIESGYRRNAALEYELGLAERPTLQNTGTAARANALADAGIAVEVIPGNRSTTRRTLQQVPHGEGFRYEYVDEEVPGSADTFRVGERTFSDPDEAQAYADSLAGVPQGTAATLSPFEYKGFQKTPGYEFIQSEGEDALSRSAAARGMLNSGAFAKDLTRFNSGLANQTYSDHLTRLQGGIASGQNALSLIASAGANNAAIQGANTVGAGQARASAYANKANGWGQALGGVAGALGGYLGGQSVPAYAGGGGTSYNALGFNPIASSPAVLSF